MSETNHGHNTHCWNIVSPAPQCCLSASCPHFPHALSSFFLGQHSATVVDQEICWPAGALQAHCYDSYMHVDNATWSARPNQDADAGGSSSTGNAMTFQVTLSNVSVVVDYQVPQSCVTTYGWYECECDCNTITSWGFVGRDSARKRRRERT
jgi:hypothetical protein